MLRGWKIFNFKDKENTTNTAAIVFQHFIRRQSFSITLTRTVLEKQSHSQNWTVFVGYVVMNMLKTIWLLRTWNIAEAFRLNG